jgi:hypothetical protein
MPSPLSVQPQLFYGGSWHTLPVYAMDGPTVVQRGYTDEGTIRPSQLNMRINDAAAPTLNPSRPASLLYGVTGRAIPAAFSAGATVRAWMEGHTLTPDQSQAYDEASQAGASPRGRRWIDVEAYGPLYRIGQWSDNVQPPMTRTTLQYANLIGFWPGDDASISTRVGLARSALNVTAQDTSAPPGASASFVGQASTQVIFSPLNASTTAGFQVFFSTKLSAVPVSPATTEFFAWRANGLLYSLQIDSIAIHLKTYSGGVLIDDSNVGIGGVGSTNFLSWVAWRAKCYQSGGNIVCEFAWYTTNEGVFGFTRTVAGTIDRLTSIRINGTSLVNGTRYAQIGAVTNITDDLQSFAALQSFNGWAGETTAARYTRLMSEAGISATVLGTTTTTMGAQKAAKLMDLLREVGATEDGLIFDQKDNPAVVMRTRRHRMNQAVGVTLNALTDVVPPFTERVDNVGVANVVTITNQDGTVGTLAKTAGQMSSAAYPSGIGTFKGGASPDVTVNLQNPAVDLPAMLSWYLAKGTVPGPRFPSVTVEVGARSPALQTAVKALEIGDRIQVTGRMADPIDLLVIGIREEIGIYTWTFTFTCVPGLPYDVGSEDDTSHRLDAKASVIITAPSPASTGTTMVVGSPGADDIWSTTSLPYPIMVSGEKMTVTACTAAALVSGNWQQTLTVTRSVNGIVKAQVVGTAVNVFAPYREVW